jgi:hypothetical protein
MSIHSRLGTHGKEWRIPLLRPRSEGLFAQAQEMAFRLPGKGRLELLYLAFKLSAMNAFTV